VSGDRKVVVVLGGSGRLGSEVIRLLPAVNYCIVNVSSSENSNLPEQVIQHAMEILDFDKFFKTLESISNRFGKIYALINFAGRSTRKRTHFISANETLNSFASEVMILLNLAEIITKQRNLFAEKFRLIDIGSLWSENTPRSSVYLDLGNEPDVSVLLAKSAKKRIIEYLAGYFSEFNVLANQVTPGWFPRPSNNPRPDYIRGIESLIPMSRIGQPTELLPAIEFLLNEENSYTNGHELVVDGGFRVH